MSKELDIMKKYPLKTVGAIFGHLFCSEVWGH